MANEITLNELEEILLCDICETPSWKINGFISTKYDVALPQPNGYGCECENNTFRSSKKNEESL